MMKKGFTIVELMIYMALMTTALVVLTQMFLSVMEIQSESGTVSNVEADGRLILARLFYDINRADVIIAPSALGQSASSLQLNIGGVSYSYLADASSDLDLVNDLGTNKLTGFDSQISNLSFVRLGNVGGKNSLQIKFRLTGRTKTKSGQQVRDFQTTVGTR